MFDFGITSVAYPRAPLLAGWVRVDFGRECIFYVRGSQDGTLPWREDHRGAW